MAFPAQDPAALPGLRGSHMLRLQGFFLPDDNIQEFHILFLGRFLYGASFVSEIWDFIDCRKHHIENRKTAQVGGQGAMKLEHKEGCLR